MNSSLLFRCIVVLTATINSATAGDWMTWRSTYTHDPMSGQRVDQHTPGVEPLAPDRGNLVRSGYRHYRSTIQAGQSADNLHIVNEWGRPVMPYEHWRFPYRPYGAPYPAWGPQTPNVLGNFGYGPGNGGAPYAGNGSASGHHPAGAASGAYGSGAYGSGGYGSGYYGGATPGAGGYPAGQGGYPGGYQGGYSGFPLVPPYQPAPWNDGMYPSAPPLDNQSDERFFYRPPSSLTP
jgi:hypothetical protein